MVELGEERIDAMSNLEFLGNATVFCVLFVGFNCETYGVVSVILH